MKTQEIKIEKVVRYDRFQRPELWLIINGQVQVRADDSDLPAILQTIKEAA
jgi:hypothetical protein